MGLVDGNSAPNLEDERVVAKHFEPEHLGQDLWLVSQANYDDKLNREQADAAVGRGPGPLERFKRWFSARF